MGYMLPVFNEYINFLKSKGLDQYLEENKLNFNIEEGYLWVDMQIIRGYDKNGEQVKVLRVNVDDELNVTFKHYKKNLPYLITWDQLIEKHKDRLNELEQYSTNVVKKYANEFKQREMIILTSGGKDSVLTEHIVKSKLKNVRLIFNNTSLDCADTYKYIKSKKDVEILNPKIGFYQWRKTQDLIPTRFARECCRIFKEGETKEYLSENEEILFFMGMRNSESSGRSGYGDLWKNKKWGQRAWDAILPIRKWNDMDVWLYTLRENLYINTKYKKGYQRVGCAIACPYYSKSTWVLDEYWYPTMYDRWYNILKDDFYKHQKWTKLNCTFEEYKTAWNGGKVRKEPTVEVLTEFADYKGIDMNLAKKYFNNKCSHDGCKRNVINKDLVAMNMKLLGRNIEKMYCKKHLMELMGIDKNEYKKLVDEFNQTDCVLF